MSDIDAIERMADAQARTLADLLIEGKVGAAQEALHEYAKVQAVLKDAVLADVITRLATAQPHEPTSKEQQ